jgi:hypothetical protein
MAVEPAVDEYIDSLPEERRETVRAVHERVLAEVPELDVRMWNKFIGYGSYHYRYASGREGDSTVIGLASNKRYISLYVAGEVDGRHLAETFAPRLPKASIGKSCVRVRRAADLDLDVVAELLCAAAAHPPGELR